MDTPIFDALVAELLARRDGQGWPAVDLDPTPEDLPTEQLIELPPELFKDWSEVPHEWGTHRSLFRSAVVAP